MNFADKLITWYSTNQRDLPWRATSEPYEIWISEVILQQTRIDQGHDYYLRFISRFPDVHSLAAAEEDDVLKMWQGLGYYSRARNLHTTAKAIVENHNGKFPETYDGLITLKGIGAYTAAAIASIAFGQATPVIDGNVLRVISRWFAIEEPVDKAAGKKMISESLSEIFDFEQPGLFNQAIMDFGALVCRPKNPECRICIFRENCGAYHQNLVNQLPNKSKTTSQTTRYFHYLVIIFDKDGDLFTVLKKRANKDIWAGLYDFPMIETTHPCNPDELISSVQWKEIFGKEETELMNISEVYKHQLTHQQLFATFFLIRTGSRIIRDDNEKIIKMADLHNFPMPRLVERYITENKAIRQVLENI